MEELKGKKLLILGATPNEIPLVQRAQAFGVYTIVTDYNTNHAISPAKDFADEYWDVSWSEQDTLEKLCREHGVDGVIAGFSEIRVDNMIQLCRRLGVPAYANEQQLAYTRNKLLFKQECRKYGLPVIREYARKEDVDQFPVIVKPADRAGSIGVTIAWNPQELDAAWDYAWEKSLTKQVIIEKYIQDGTEMDLHYGVTNGKVFLLTSDDIVGAAGNKTDGKVIQTGWVHPQKYEDVLLQRYNQNFVDMIQGWGIENGTIFFSAFVNDQAELAVFECGFRMWGEQDYEYNARNGLLNYLDIYISHALTGRSPECGMVRKGLKCVEVNLYASKGTVSAIGGMDQIAAMPNCTLAITNAYIGQKCEDDRAILSKLALIGFAHEDPVQLKKDIEEAYRLFYTLDENGQDMVYDRMDPELITQWWS